MSVSDGTLLSAQKCAKSVKGTPLKIPDFTGVPIDPRSFFGTQFTIRESFASLARSCGDNLSISAFALECLVHCSFVLRWGAEIDDGPDSLLGKKFGASLRQNETSGKAETEEVSAPFW